MILVGPIDPPTIVAPIHWRYSNIGLFGVVIFPPNWDHIGPLANFLDVAVPITVDPVVSDGESK